MNFIRILCSGFTKNFSSKAAQDLYPLGSKSNISRIKSALIERELIEELSDGTIRLSDTVFQKWFTKEWM